MTISEEKLTKGIENVIKVYEAGKNSVNLDNYYTKSQIDNMLSNGSGSSDSNVELVTKNGQMIALSTTDETDLSIELTSDIITDFSSVNFYRTGKNLFDISSAQGDQYIRLVESTGKSIKISNSRTIEHPISWYTVLPAGTYNISSLSYGKVISIYTSISIDGTYALAWQIKPANGETNKSIKLTDTTYLKISTYCAASSEITIEDIQIEIGNEMTDYEPYKGQKITPNSSGRVENVVSCKPTTVLYTDNGDVVVNVEYSIIHPQINIVDNLESTDINSALSANQGRILNEKLNNHHEQISNLMPTSKVIGLKMAIIGDSISYGVSSVMLSNGTAAGTSGNNLLTFKNKAWWQLVKDRYNIADNVLNNSQTGASFSLDGSTKDDNGNVINRRFTTYLNSNDLPEDLDIIMVFGGTNDWSQSRPLGSIDDEPNLENQATFCGAVKAVLDYLTTNFPEKQIIFITPLQRYRNDTFNAKNTQNLYMQDYVNAIKILCAAYGVKFIDLYSNSKFHMNSENFRTKYVPDGTHPNETGTERYVTNGIFPTLDNLWLSIYELEE